MQFLRYENIKNASLMQCHVNCDDVLTMTMQPSYTVEEVFIHVHTKIEPNQSFTSEDDIQIMCIKPMEQSQPI